MTPFLAAVIVLLVALAGAAALIAVINAVNGARYDRQFERPEPHNPFGDVQWPPHA